MGGFARYSSVIFLIKWKTFFSKDEKVEHSKEQPKEYFYFFDFVKVSEDIKKRPEIKLLPCLYKKR